MLENPNLSSECIKSPTPLGASQNQQDRTISPSDAPLPSSFSHLTTMTLNPNHNVKVTPTSTQLTTERKHHCGSSLAAYRTTEMITQYPRPARSSVRRKPVKMDTFRSRNMPVPTFPCLLEPTLTERNTTSTVPLGFPVHSQCTNNVVTRISIP